MASDSVPPRHDPNYRLELPGGLLIRWSTPEDIPGMALTSGLAWGADEGYEADGNLILAERMARDDFYYGHPRWAICVGTNGPLAFPRGPPKTVETPIVPPNSHAERIRELASQAREPVLALVSYHLLEWQMSGHPIKVFKHCFVASRPSYRIAGGGGAGVMKELFAMCRERALHEGAAFGNVLGIPNYYRSHGFEHAMRLGNGFTTHSSLVLSSKPSSTFRSRAGVPSDAPTLFDFHKRLAKSSPLWMGPASPAAVEAELKWNLGERSDAFPSDKHPPLPSLVITDSNDRAVAAVVWILRNEPDRPIEKRLAVIRVLYDPEANLTVLAKELVVRAWAFQKDLVNAELARLEALGIQVAGNEMGLQKIRWNVSAAFPIMKAAEAQGLVLREGLGSSYTFMAETYLSIPSLPQFLSSLQPVLDDRLMAAKASLGLPSTQLRIATYASSYVGCVIDIKDGRIDFIEPRQFTGAHIVAYSRFDHGGFRNDELPNVLSPYGALVKLLMGFASLEEIRWIVPDLSVSAEVRQVVEVLFPVLPSITFNYG